MHERLFLHAVLQIEPRFRDGAACCTGEKSMLLAVGDEALKPREYVEVLVARQTNVCSVHVDN